MIDDKKTYFMKKAILEAKKAAKMDEVPIGAVIVKDGKIIARGFNRREKKNDVTSHAEIEAIRKANKKLSNWRLVDCDIYITTEPCLMCMGALYQAHIRNIYYGASDPKGGAVSSSINFKDIKNLNHYPNIEGGILKDECSSILKDYFKNKRDMKKQGE